MEANFVAMEGKGYLDHHPTVHQPLHRAPEWHMRPYILKGVGQAQGNDAMQGRQRAGFGSYARAALLCRQRQGRLHASTNDRGVRPQGEGRGAPATPLGYTDPLRVAPRATP